MTFLVKAKVLTQKLKTTEGCVGVALFCVLDDSDELLYDVLFCDLALGLQLLHSEIDLDLDERMREEFGSQPVRVAGLVSGPEDS